MEWATENQFTLDGISFRTNPWADFQSNSRRFLLAKERPLVEYYVDLVDRQSPRNIVELGVFQGGSIAFLATLAKPDKLVAIELEEGPAVALEELIAEQQLHDRVRPYFGVDQADSTRVRKIVEEEFGGEPIDLVIDDASHWLGPSRSSFNTIFPYVRPGGWYVIEDWALLHLDLPSGDDGGPPLSVLGFELMMVAGSRGGVVDQVEVTPYVIAARRGDAPLDPGTFDIQRCYNDASRQLIDQL